MLIMVNRNKKFAFSISCIVYLALALLVAILTGVGNFSSGDPELIAGRIAENIVSAILVFILAIPVLAIIFSGYKWLKMRQTKK